MNLTFFPIIPHEYKTDNLSKARFNSIGLKEISLLLGLVPLQEKFFLAELTGEQFEEPILVFGSPFGVCACYREFDKEYQIRLLIGDEPKSSRPFVHYEDYSRWNYAYFIPKDVFLDANNFNKILIDNLKSEEFFVHTRISQSSDYFELDSWKEISPDY